MYAYLEPSAVDAAVRARMGPAELRSRLGRLGFDPATGLHTLHECARSIVRGRPAVARPIFQFLLELEPTFFHPADVLLDQEVGFIRGSGGIAPALDPENIRLTYSEMRLLAKGNISRELRELVVERDRGIASRWPASSGWYLGQVKELRRRDPNAAPRPATFEAFVASMQSSLGTWVLGLAHGKLTQPEVERVVRNLDILIAHRTQLRLWMYLAFICVHDGRTPSHDRLDDFRHVLEGSYCNAFVTNDGSLMHAVPRLHPQLIVVAWPEVAGDAA